VGLLITTNELHDRLNQQNPDTVVFDWRRRLMDPAQGRLDFEAGHIPTGTHAGMDSGLSAAPMAGGQGGRHPLPQPERLAH